MASTDASPGRSSDSPIEILDDNDPVLPEDERRVQLTNEVRNFASRPSHHQRVIVIANNRPSEDSQEDEIVAELREVIDLTEDRPRPEFQSREQPRASQTPSSPTKRHQRIHFGGRKIKVNFVYEISNTRGRQRVVDFLRVTDIHEHLSNKTVHIRGIPYTRNRNLRGQLPPKVNEVCMIYDVYEEDPRTLEEQATIEVPISHIGGPRRLHTTNAPYPLHRWDPRAFRTKAEVETSGPLVCRWKVVYQYLGDPTSTKKLLPRAFQIIRLRAEDVAEADLKYSDDKLRVDWRGETIRGGSYRAPQGPLAPGTVDRSPEQRYTLFDAFCGAGGVSRGAERSGFHVQYAVDVWDKACSSHRMNFPDTELYESDIFGFIQATANSAMIADVVHLSPPCQFWSPAHTVNSQHDEDNIAALFACRSIIDKVRPRMFTLEQTFGIMRERFADAFNCLIDGFTDHNYSVEWKIIECENYGLPQHRRRLVIIGAGPGETLPPWPAITHSRDADSGLKPFNTIRQALQPIAQVRDDPHHRPRPCPPSKDSVVSNPDDILRRCMTTSGGQNRHFDNTRSYTNREFACLQGFPIWHQFTNVCARKQIGNAFPPCVVQVFYEAIQKHLYHTDGFTRDPRPVLPVVPQDIINLTDEGESADDDDGPVEIVSSFFASQAARGARLAEREVITLLDDEMGEAERRAATKPRKKPAAHRAQPPDSFPETSPTTARVTPLQARFRYSEEKHRRPSQNPPPQASRPLRDHRRPDLVEVPGPSRPRRTHGTITPSRRHGVDHARLNVEALHIDPYRRPPPLQYHPTDVHADVRVPAPLPSAPPFYSPYREVPPQRSFRSHYFGPPPYVEFGRSYRAADRLPQPTIAVDGDEDAASGDTDEMMPTPRSRTASLSGRPRRNAVQDEQWSGGQDYMALD